MNSPYSKLPSSSFWKSGVAGQSAATIQNLYRKKFEIAPDSNVATAGSCFAQHIGKSMRAHGFSVLDAEPPPPGLPDEVASQFGYGLYSARHGNIYTARQLLQLTQEALGKRTPQFVWEKNGRFYDALRPSVEPEGLSSPEEVSIHRQSHLRKFKSVLKQADLFVFTFGLTEAWMDRSDATVYPTAPGTIAGSYDSALHAFKNFSFREVYSDFVKFRQVVQKFNPDLRFLITVSPVPLTATATPAHVLSATVHSKSILRAVAGQLYDEFEDVDYFPSFEVISTPFLGNQYCEHNMRSVSEAGVKAAMRIFFDEHQRGQTEEQLEANKAVEPEAPSLKSTEDVICEEALLEAFAK